MLFEQQKRGLTLGADVVIATPGRLIAHLSLGYVDLSRVSYFILDEADRMLDMGFYDDIMQIVKFLPKGRQTIMFSATMPAKIQQLAKSILNNPAEVKLAVSKPAEKIVQAAYVCYENQKLGIIRSLFAEQTPERVIIFASSKLKVKEVTKALKQMKLNVGEMHSDLEQAQREEVMYEFKAGRINILVATDIVARGIDIDDIFSSFFGGFGGRRSNNPNAPSRGSDVEASIYISFEEAAKGCKKTVSYDCVSSCDECHGTGAKPGTQPKTCSVCGGSGRVTISQRSPFGVVQTQRACDACHGKGKIIDSPCPKCGGSGRKRRTKTVDITVPAGIKDQQILNVGGRGNAGYNGGPSGDLHVYVNVQPHPVFERRGDDVWCNLPLTFAQAALGAEVVVPTLDGKVSYQVHEGTQPGDVFKLKGKGIQRLNGRGKGDQYVRVTIEVPKNLNAKQKNLIKEFENVTNEKNYAQRNSFFEKIKRMFNE